MAAYFGFASCPICLGPEPSSQEHVPPSSLGGQVLTSTCELCNNRFGSKYEEDLALRADTAMKLVGVSGDAFVGHRSLGSVPLRMSTQGHPIMFVDSPHEDFANLLAGGHGFRLRYEVPDAKRVGVAILKSTYLAACVIQQKIPHGPVWDSVRDELLTYRDRPLDAEVTLGRHVEGLRFTFQDVLARSPRVALAVYQAANVSPEFFVTLSDRLVVRWPFGGVISARQPSGGTTFVPLGGPTE